MVSILFGLDGTDNTMSLILKPDSEVQFSFLQLIEFKDTSLGHRYH